MIDENIVIELVRKKIITDTFRRLDSSKKERIYLNSLKLFGKFGYDGLAIEIFCKDAGISKGSFFQYFPSKTHLLEFAILLYDDYLANLMNKFKEFEKAILVKDRLFYLFQALGEHFSANPIEHQFYLFATNALNHAGVTLEGFNLQHHLQKYIDEIILRGIETKEIRKDYPYEMTSTMLMLFYHALLSRQHETLIDSDELENYLITFLFDGIKA